MRVKKYIKGLIKFCTGCTILYKTEWYKTFFIDLNHEIYPDNTWYRNHSERNFDLVNLGSSGGKWAFDYTETGVKGLNWAQQPQTLYEDYQLLRHYHSILRKGGYVLITIMPFTGVNKKTYIRDAMKYLKIDTQGEPIQPVMYRKACRYAEYPILFGKQAIKALIKFILCKEKTIVNTQNMDCNPMTDDELERDADKWMKGWKSQFNIVDFEASLTEQNIKGREYRVNLMRELVDFCIERGYRPVYVIPPVTEFLAKKFTSRFRDIYIYDYLHQVDRNVLMLDYSEDKELNDSSFYFNSFFLNFRGRKLFTKRVLMDLNLL